MNTTELHTYLALAGNQRLPHLEAEIFADAEATKMYLHNICNPYEWYGNWQTAAYLACQYAFFVISARWPAAEAVIAVNYVFWELYSARILNNKQHSQ